MNAWRNDPVWKAQRNGARYGVWYLDGYTYEGYDWITPIYRQVAQFDTMAEAEQAAAQAAAADTTEVTA